MNKPVLKSDSLLLTTAGIWGFGFAAQKSGMEFLGPFGFNGVRFLLGSLFLLPLVLVRKTTSRDSPEDREAPVRGRNFFCASFLAGLLLFIGASLQTAGLLFTTTGNSGFITGLYVVLVPIIGIFFGRKTGLPTWIGAGLTFTGLFFLCTTGSAAGSAGRINPGDLMTLVSAFFWSLHVLLLDRLVKKADPVKLCHAQFAWCGILSLFTVLICREPISPEGLKGSLIPLLYGGLVSVGIGNTLQAVAQRHAPPAHAVIILCLEGCFAALAGALLFDEIPGVKALFGAALMLCGMLVTQWDVIRGNHAALQERS
jgi:drug/metabolite transporter (DMT)-like permease